MIKLLLLLLSLLLLLLLSLLLLLLFITDETPIICGPGLRQEKRALKNIKGKPFGEHQVHASKIRL